MSCDFFLSNATFIKTILMFKQLRSKLVLTDYYNYNLETGLCCLTLDGSDVTDGAHGINPNPDTGYTTFYEVGLVLMLVL